MNEPMDREELIEATVRSLQWMVDDGEEEFRRGITLNNMTVQRSLREALGFLQGLKALEETPHGV